MNYLKQKAWSPYAAGIVIGLLQIPAILLVAHVLGASSCYVSLGGWIARLFDGEVMQIGYFEKYMTSMKYLWQGSLVIGIAVGAFLSKTLSGAKRQSYSPIWRRTLGLTSPAQRFAVAFLGGFLMLFGARWAGGCTSGHGLSGIGQLALASIVVVISFFVGGIVVANLFRRI